MYTNSSNALFAIDINEVTGVNNEICHDILTNESTYALYFIPTGFQVYACNIIIKQHLFV